MRKNPSLHKGKTNPVDSVRWTDAAEFCAKVAQRAGRSVHLPTEAQWEWACRAGTATRYFFGDDESKLSTYCWWHDNCGGTTHPVGLKKPNAWGLYDMHGLAWEWCSDFFADSYAAGKAADPQGPVSGAVHSARGGTFGSRPPFLRSALRLGVGDGTVNDRFGFRAAMDVE
jgi:formylglycine-generating enzyme required for sulfatase activity